MFGWLVDDGRGGAFEGVNHNDHNDEDDYDQTT